MFEVLTLGFISLNEIATHGGFYADSFGCCRVMRNHFHETMLLTAYGWHVDPNAFPRPKVCGEFRVIRED